MKKMVYILILLLISFNIYAYDETTIHPLINEKAALKSTNFISMLREWGYKENATDDIITANSVNNLKIKDWIRLGGKEEDSGFRYVHHFHDPTRTWDVAGLGGKPEMYSSLLWAQNKQANNTLLTNDWSWAAARTYYYQALTEQATNLREKNLADSLRSLGQVMHLLADAAVPEHARDDLHPFDNFEIIYPAGSRYETWARDNAAPLVESGGTAVNPSITNTSLVPNINPISNFWDTTPAEGYGGTLLGLAEYTNYNFLSPDTIFKKYTYPVNPQLISGYIQVVHDIDESFDERVYFTGTTSDLKPIRHLVSANYFWSDLERVSPGSMNSSKFILDENCFNDYAQILVPKAVDYDAALLDYFFRGTIEITPPDENVYAITDGSITPYNDAYDHQHQEFRKIKARVRNTTPNNEQIGAGTLQAVARYKIRIDYQPDLSHDPTAEHPEWGVSEDDFSYSVSEPRTLTSDEIAAINAGPMEFTFNFPATNPIPAGITDLYLQVVFKGTLGNETDNAIAVGMKDLAEPAHHVFWNLSDQFSLLYKESTDASARYHLYAANQITTDTAPNGKASKVDFNHNGIFSESGEPYIFPYLATYEISYLSGTNPGTPPPVAARITNLPAGRHIRLVVVQDRDQVGVQRISYVHAAGVVNTDFLFGEPIMNQTEPDGYFYYTSVYAFRHGDSSGVSVPIKHHLATIITTCFPAIEPCPYPETESLPAELSPYGPVEVLFNN